MYFKKGIPVSPGISIGKAFVLDSEEYRIPKRSITSTETKTEIAKFENAIQASTQELNKLIKKLARKIGGDTAPIIESHIKMITDEHIKSKIIDAIKNNLYTAEYAVSLILNKYAKTLSLNSDNNPFITNRVIDIYDIEKRILRNLLGRKREDLSDLTEAVIIVGRDLSPSQTALLDKENVKGFATDGGGKTSHTAIIARAMGIPAVVGLQTLSLEITGSDEVIIDGNNGIVIVNPDKETTKKYTVLGKNFVSLENKLAIEVREYPAETKDGRRISIYANIELAEEVNTALQYGAEGIGLFRTEFLYPGPEYLPTEKDHFNAYKKVAIQMGKQEVVVRTLDAGGDKVNPIYKSNPEKNPFLGFRAIRLCLNLPEMFKAQLQAILRASEYGNISIMFPMIASREEINQARQLIEEVKKELDAKKIPFNNNIRIGAMIEIPSAAIAIDTIMEDVDFVSIGTNDLIQYTMAVDRGNEKIAYLYQPSNISILRLIKNIIDEGERQDKSVAMCGEMAGDRLYTILLIGMGLKIFSMTPVVIPEIKKIIRSITYSEAKKVVEKVFTLESPKKTTEYLRDYGRRIIPQLFE
ncbi:MAG: phosphoenolpyruvate--protein phosphotransferase [Candidatus Brocadiia bacterium]